VNAATHELAFEGQASFKYDLLVVIPPHRGPHLVREAGLANEAGWVPVDRATLATRYENVCALGNVTAISIPGRWKPNVPLTLPKVGVFTHAQASPSLTVFRLFGLGFGFLVQRSHFCFTSVTFRLAGCIA
jgi:sulfide:quinone oxidoreductase